MPAHNDRLTPLDYVCGIAVLIACALILWAAMIGGVL